MRGIRTMFKILFFVIIASCQGMGGYIQIGEINPLTGKFAIQGISIHEGITLAIDEVNSKGGIKNRKVKLITRDDQSIPDRAVNSAEELCMKYRVKGIIGGYVDSLVGPVSDIAERFKTPYIATASLDERLTKKGYKYFFRLSSLDGFLKTTAGIIKAINPERIAIFYSSTPGSTQLAEKQREILRRVRIQVVSFEMFTPGISDFAPLVLKAKKLGADLILSDGFFIDNLMIVRAIRAHNLKFLAFVGTFGMEFPEVIKELGASANNIIGTAVWMPDLPVHGAEMMHNDFINAFRKKWGKDPVNLSLYGYCAAKVLLRAIEDAMEKTAEPSGSSIADELRRIEMLTPMGRIGFNERGDPRYFEVRGIQIQDSRHVVIYPQEAGVGIRKPF